MVGRRRVATDPDPGSRVGSRAFEVRTTDRRFINDLLDAKMLAALHDRAQGYAIEFVGNRALVARPRTDPPDVATLVELGADLIAAVPEVVRRLYPGPAGRLPDAGVPHAARRQRADAPGGTSRTGRSRSWRLGTGTTQLTTVRCPTEEAREGRLRCPDTPVHDGSPHHKARPEGFEPPTF